MKGLNRLAFERIICFTLTLSGLIVFFLRVIFAGSYITETGGVSVNVMYALQHLIKTGQLYLNPEQPPFSIVQYMPLHYYIVAFLSKIFQTNGDVHTTMIFHRSFCLLCDLLSVMAIISVVKKLFPDVSKLNRSTIGFFYFVTIPSINFARVDSLYLLFFILAINHFAYFIKQESNNPQKKHLIFSAAYTCLALLSKQTAVFLFIFLFAYLLLIVKNYKAFFLYFFGTLALFTLILVFIIPSFPDFKLNVVDGLKNGVNLNWFLEVFIKNFFLKYAVLLGSGIYLGQYLLKSPKTDIGFFIGIGSLFFLSSALVASLKLGSGPNYYLEFTIFTLLAIAYFLQVQPGLSKNYFCFAACVLPFFILTCMNDKGWSHLPALKKTKRDFKECAIIASYVEKNTKQGEYILSAFHKENCLNLLLSETALFPCREVALYQTYPQGVFKFAKFKELVSNKKIAFYIDEKGSSPGKFLDSDLSTMLPDTIIGNYSLYKFPK